MGRTLLPVGTTAGYNNCCLLRLTSGYVTEEVEP